MRAYGKDLREATVVEADETICAAAYSDLTAFIGPSHICAGLGTDGNDACQGDSGGPLVVMDRSQCLQQVGIVSWGIGCGKGGRFGVYTRVSSYSNWIDSTILSLKVNEKPDFLSAFETDKMVFEQFEELIADKLGQKSGGVSILLSYDDKRVKLGQEFSVEIKTEISGSLWLLDLDSGGDLTIHPMEKFIRKGETKRYRFKAAPPVGRAHLIAIVAPQNFTMPTGHRTNDDQTLIGFVANFLKETKIVGGSKNVQGEWAIGGTVWAVVE